jgi:hypothetical protein
MHQPSSINLRLFIITGMIYGLGVALLSYQKYYAEVFKRKRMRMIEL